MKLSPPIVIAEEKIAKYLLMKRDEDDKSRFLGLAGYSLNQPGRLIEDLHTLATKEAEFLEKTEYGDKYRIRGILAGPNGKSLKVISIWMAEEASGTTKFITLFPDRT